MEDKISKGSNYKTKWEHDNSGPENFVHPPFKISGSAPAIPVIDNEMDKPDQLACIGYKNQNVMA